MSIKVDKKLILKKIKDYYGYNSDSDFAAFLGIKPTTLSSWYSRNTFDFELLYSKCVDINPEFFFTGKGKMLKKDLANNEEEKTVTKTVTFNAETKNAKNVTVLENENKNKNDNLNDNFLEQKPNSQKKLSIIENENEDKNEDILTQKPNLQKMSSIIENENENKNDKENDKENDIKPNLQNNLSIIENENENKEGKDNGKVLGKKPNMQNILPFSIIPFRLRTDKNTELQVIPIYSMEASAGLVSLLDNPTSKNVIDYISIPNLPNCDGALYVTGDSMYPLLKSGDIVAYKQIHDVQNDIFYGEMYIVSLDLSGEELVTVKYVQKSEKEGYIRLVSQNQNHKDKDVSLSKIRALALIKASIRYNMMY